MAEYVPTEEHMENVLILLFHLKKTVSEAQKELEDVYGTLALPIEICEYWFKKFEKNDFSLKEDNDYAKLKNKPNN